MKLSVVFSVLGCVLIAIGTDGHDKCNSVRHPLQTLVSGSNGVPDSALTASSSWDYKHGPNRARLHTVPDSKSPFGAWCPKLADRSSPWIQVRFKKERTVKKIQTQGRSDAQYLQYPTKYKVSTSKDCTKFTYYKENGQIKIFDGNSDRNTVVTQTLKYPQVTRCLRIHVLRHHGFPCLRFDILACPSGYSYKLIKEKFSWPDAVAYCKWEGGKLATIETTAENNWLKKYLEKQASHYTTVKQRTCQATTLVHARGITEGKCYYLCKIMPKCTAFVTRASTKECWAMSCSKENLVSSKNQDIHFIVSRTGDIWINLNRVYDHTQWVTGPGTPAKFYNWDKKQPDGYYVENCATISPQHEYRWTSKPCTSRLYFVCEI